MNKNFEMADKVNIALTELEREYSSMPSVAAVFGAFALYIAHNCPEETDLKAIINHNALSPVLSRAVIEQVGGHWEKYRQILTAYSQGDLTDYFSVFVTGDRLSGGKRMMLESSQPIADLAVRILDLRPGDSVCDIGCAAGDFLCRAAEGFGDGKAPIVLTGVECDVDLAALAELRMFWLGLKADISVGSVFARTFGSLSCDRVFCDVPLGVRGLPQDDDVRRFIEREFPDFPELSPSMQGDWLFAARAVAAMKKDGRAVAILSPSAMFDVRNEPYRRYFIQRNLIEAVVELPTRLFAHTNIGTYLVVFSTGNESVTMVRAGELCYPNRRSNVIGKGHVDVIAACLGLSAARGREGLEEYCVTVPKTEVLKGTCDLSVKLRFTAPEVVKDGVEFGSLVMGVRRGAAISSSELDAEASEDDTPFLYLAPGDINDGVLSDDLLRLNGIPEKYATYAARNGDIVITRVMASGADFKVSVVEVPEGKTVLPNGNLLVVSVDPEKADPYFIKACLDSEYAQRYLADSSVGSVLRTLSYKNLEHLAIPDVPLSRQREIGKVCRETVQRVVSLRAQYLAEKKRLGTILEDHAGDCLNTVDDGQTISIRRTGHGD